MAAFDVLTFNGVTLSSTTMQAYWDQRDEYDTTASLEIAQRIGGRSQVTGVALDPVVRVVRITRASGTLAAFIDDVVETFGITTSLTPRTLTYTAADGSTTVRLTGYLTSRRFVAENPLGEFWVTMVVPDGIAVADNPTTSLSDPATVTNAGSIAVAPVVTLTTATHITHRACTVADTGGRGLFNYPVVFDLNDANATTTNVHVYVEGVLVDSFVDNSGAADSRVWALVDCAADGSTTAVDILYGTGLANPRSQMLSEAGPDFTVSTNTSWTWRSNGWDVEDYGDRPGVWRPARLGNHSAAAEATAQITASGSTCVISLGAAGTYQDGGYDALVLSLGGARAQNIVGGLTNLRRITANLDGTNARGFVRHQRHGSQIWTEAWNQTTNATVTTALNVGTAVKISVGIENFGTTADPATLTIGGAAAVLALEDTPTVVVGAAANYDRYDGTYTIGSTTITADEVWVPDGTLTIDCVDTDISSSAAGPTFGSWSYSDPDNWLIVESGVNTVTDGLSATDAVSFRAGFGA